MRFIGLDDQERIPLVGIADAVDEICAFPFSDKLEFHFRVAIEGILKIFCGRKVDSDRRFLAGVGGLELDDLSAMHESSQSRSPLAGITLAERMII